MFIEYNYVKNCFIVLYINIAFFLGRRRSVFAKKGVFRGRFAWPRRGVTKKKFKIFTAVPQRVGMDLRKKVKKNFGGLKNGRIFAPAFERGRRPQEGAGEREGESRLKRMGPER